MSAVRVKGLAQLDRTFGRLSKDLRKDVRAELKDVAAVVADEAKQIAGRKGLRVSGKLIGSIRPATRGTTALVRASATTRGFNYPRRLEYESGGRRGFLVPALDAKTPAVLERMDRVLDRLGRNFEKKG